MEDRSRLEGIECFARDIPDEMDEATLQRHRSILAQKEAEAFATAPALCAVVQEARRHGCEVQAVAYRSPYSLGIKRGLLRINGRPCIVRQITVATKHPKMKLAKAHKILSLKEVRRSHAYIARVAIPSYPERWFIVPCAAIASKYPSTAAKAHISLPLVRQATSWNPLLNYWQYENAWHILEAC